MVKAGISWLSVSKSSLHFFSNIDFGRNFYHALFTFLFPVDSSAVPTICSGIKSHEPQGQWWNEYKWISAFPSRQVCECSGCFKNQPNPIVAMSSVFNQCYSTKITTGIKFYQARQCKNSSQVNSYRKIHWANRLQFKFSICWRNLKQSISPVIDFKEQLKPKESNLIRIQDISKNITQARNSIRKTNKQKFLGNAIQCCLKNNWRLRQEALIGGPDKNTLKVIWQFLLLTKAAPRYLYFPLTMMLTQLINCISHNSIRVHTELFIPKYQVVYHCLLFPTTLVLSTSVTVIFFVLWQDAEKSHTVTGNLLCHQLQKHHDQIGDWTPER